MPNHVEQDITVSGPLDDVKQFKGFAEEDEYLLSANKFIPYPEHFRKLDEQGEEEYKKGNYSFVDGFNSGGYKWCRDNWGTKWGIYRTTILTEKYTKKTGKIKYTCRSAWSPAFPVFRAMSLKFPNLKIEVKYYESGMQYKGIYSLYNGKVTKDEQSKYKGRRGG